MEQTETTAPPARQGRFARPPAEPAPQPAVAPPAQAGLAATRVIARRWPRTVPAKRVFPRS